MERYLKFKFYSLLDSSVPKINKKVVSNSKSALRVPSFQVILDPWVEFSANMAFLSDELFPILLCPQIHWKPIENNRDFTPSAREHYLSDNRTLVFWTFVLLH